MTTVDLLTERAAVVLQDRPVVAFTPWLADVLHACADDGRGLQVVTTEDARITMPLRLMLTGPDSRWVVRDSGSGDYFDGLSGARLQYADGLYGPADDSDETLAPVFGLADPPTSTQLTLTFRVTNPATRQTVLGGAPEQMARALSGEPPQAWGTAEPMGEPWRPVDFTALCRERMPEPTWLFARGGGGRPVIVSERVSRSEAGVEEWGTLVVGFAADDPPPLEDLPNLVAAISAQYHVVSMFVQLRPGGADLHSPARWEGLPMPVGMVVGPDGVGNVGLDRALNPPGGTAHALDSPFGPTVWYRLGDGRSSDGWQLFERIMRHMRLTGE